MTTRTQAAAKVTVSVCLYGTPTRGFGWLASAAGESTIHGNASLDYETMTEAVWAAGAVLLNSGHAGKLAEVVEPNGQRRALITIGTRIPTVGSLKWEAANVYELAADAIALAADADLR